MKNISLIISFLILSSHLLAFDVVGDKRIILVSTHPINVNLRSLESCFLDKKSNLIVESCEQIGSREYYSTEYLKNIRVDEYIEASAKLVADAAIVIAMIYGGAIIVGTGALGAKLFLAIGAGGGAIGGGLTGLAITGYVNKLNPIRQFKQGAVLSDDLMNDIRIEKSDEKIEEMVELLNEIL